MNSGSPFSEKKRARISGIHPVLEALQSGAWLDKIFVKQGLEGPNVLKIKVLARERGVPVKEVPPQKLRALGLLPAQGVVAEVSPVPFVDLENTIAGVYEQGCVPLLVMLDGITDVRNVGSIVRSLVCAGGQGLIVAGSRTAAFSPDMVKASAGALFHTALHRFDKLDSAVKILKNCGIKVVGLTEKTRQSLFQCDLSGPLCLVLGDEEKGLSSILLQACNELASIPMPGNFSSLNVGHAAAVALFETVRQRL